MIGWALHRRWDLYLIHPFINRLTDPAHQFAPIIAYHTKTFSNRGEEASPQEAEIKVQISDLLQKCKTLARSIKVDRPSRGLSLPELNLAPLSREVADVRVNLYFQFFESAHRILHVPTFWMEYQSFWESPSKVPAGIRLKILLVIGVGSSISNQQVVDGRFPAMVQQWIYTAQSWLSGLLEKDRLNITGLQVHCLTLLARQIFSIGGDLVWMSMGSLIHHAMQIGLHRDPKHLPKLSLLQAEIRRRLWATILDMVIQSSLDSAMPPRISLDEFDTEAPANINDHEVDDSTKVLLVHPRSTFTSTSIQLILFDSLHIRLRVLQLLNGVNSELYYPDVLTLSAELTEACRACSKFLDDNRTSGVTAFHRNLLECLLRRFLLPLHSPFASKARTNHLFYYSRKVVLDTAMAMMCSEPDEHFSQLMSIGGGIFRECLRCALSAITLELISQTETQRLDGTLERNSKSRDILKQIVKDIMSLSLERIRQGETNIKSHTFLSMILSLVEATETGTPYLLKMAESAKDSLELCYGLLQSRVDITSASCPNNAGALPTSFDDGYAEYGLDLDLDLDLDFFYPHTDTF